MKSFIKIVLLLIVPLNLFSQEIMQRPDARDIFSDKTINEQYEPVKLVFDFSKKDVLSYDYSAFNDSFSESSLFPGTTNQKSKTTSKLTLNMLGNGYAEIVFKDIIVDSQISFDIPNDDISEDDEPVNTKFGPRTAVYQYLSEDGKFLNSQDMEFRIKLMMPSSGLIIKENEILEEDINMPLNFSGSLLQIKGKLYIRGLGVYLAEDKQYLKIESRLELNSDDIPDVLKDQLELLIVSEGIYYYDIKEKSYYSGDITITTSISAKTIGLNLIDSTISQKMNATEHIEYKASSD
ncbi:MAG: hypothetical protein IKR40_03365 [Treponema sp.]|nr:hypothetical protein [Treponema sp.]